MPHLLLSSEIDALSGCLFCFLVGGGGQFQEQKNKNATRKDLESRASEVLELPDVSPKING